MAGYTVLNAQYNPRSFDEMLKPLAIYEDQYRQVESSLSDLQEKSDLSTIINPQTDKISNARYLAYQEELKKVADDLNQNQLTPNTRKSIFDLKAKYAKQIAPILGAYKTYATNIQKKREALQKDNSLITDDASNSYTLDDFLKNPNLSYTGISGKEITKRVVDIAKPYSEMIRSVSNWETTAEGELIQRITSKGITAKDINDIMTNPDKFPQLTSTIQSILESTGVQNMGIGAAKKALGYVVEGLSAGMGKQDITVKPNERSAYNLWKRETERLEFNQKQQDRQDKEDEKNAPVSREVSNDLVNTETKIKELDKSLNEIDQIQNEASEYYKAYQSFKNKKVNINDLKAIDVNLALGKNTPKSILAPKPSVDSSPRMPHLGKDIQALADKYDIEITTKDGQLLGLDKLKLAIENEKAKTSTLTFNHVVNEVYNEPITNMLYNLTKAKISTGTATKLLRPIDEKGNEDKDEEVSRDIITDYFNKTSTYTYDTKKNQLVVTSHNKGVKPQSAVVDLSIYDNKSGKYKELKNRMKQALDKNQFSDFNTAKDEFMNLLVEEALILNQKR